MENTSGSTRKRALALTSAPRLKRSCMEEELWPHQETYSISRLANPSLHFRDLTWMKSLDSDVAVGFIEKKQNKPERFF